MANPSPMNAGNHEYSYANNSSYQKFRFDATKDMVKEAILESFEVEKQETSCDSNTVKIVDLGCSSGPNTFFAMQSIVESIASKYAKEEEEEEVEFQVFFNDMNGNDFNTLFASLPKYSNGKYYAAGVPGSFHGRLFPSSSIHVFNCFFALHWLSKSPEDLIVRDSPAWNGGRIHYFGASEAVFRAYSAQFERDFDVFLKARARETAPGGLVIIYTRSDGTFEGTSNTETGVWYSFLASILLEMVEEGLIKEDQVDAFNTPHMDPSVNQITGLVKKDGSFSIEKVELRDPLAKNSEEFGLTHFRAATEATFAGHFGKETANEMFKRAFRQEKRLLDSLEASGTKGTPELYVVLKRKR